MAKTNGKSYEIDMCNGPIFPKMLRFAVPLMCSSILQLLFNAADIVVVGRFAGDNALAAVGSTTSLIALLTNLFMGLSIGANVIVARYFGAKDYDSLSKAVHTAVSVSILSGVALTVIGELLARFMLELMQTDPKIIELSTVYLRIYFLGMTAMMIYNFCSAILRASGDTKRPLYYLAIAGVINVCLNLFFVIVLKMSVAGVAIATAASQCVSAFLVIRCLVRENGAVKVELKKLRIHKDKLMQIVRVGVPAGLQGTMFAISNVVIQSSVNTFGATIVAGNTAQSNIEQFLYVSLNSFHQAALSFTSQNYGAGNYKRINKILICGLLTVAVFGTAISNLVYLFGRELLGIYSSSGPVIEAGLRRMSVILPAYATCGMMDLVVGSIRGMGYSIMPMIVSLVGVCGFRLAWIFCIFGVEKWHTMESLYWSYPISWVMTFVAHMICYIIVKRKLDKSVRLKENLQ